MLSCSCTALRARSVAHVRQRPTLRTLARPPHARFMFTPDSPSFRSPPAHTRRARLYQLVERCTSVSVKLSPDGKLPDSQDGLLPELVKRWSALPLQQKAMVAVAGVAGGFVAWKVLTLALVLVERVLVGSLIALEEVLVSAIVRGVSLVFVLATVALLAYATYYLVIGTEDRWR